MKAKTSLGLSLEYRTKPIMLHRDQGAARHLREHEAILTGEREEGGAPVFLGKQEFTEASISGCINDGLPVLSLLDQDDETQDVASLIFDDLNGDKLRDDLDEEMGGEPLGRIINLKFLTVMPFARGKKLGLTILDNILRDHPSETIFVMRPKPLQCVEPGDGWPDWSNMNLQAFPQDEKAGTRKLCAYYKRLGFKPLGDGWLYMTTVDRRPAFSGPDYINLTLP